MVNWDFLIEERALAALLPDEYARFARPVKDGLALFLSGLQDARQQRILADQSTLPPTATVSQRLGRVAQSCPVLHKLGQILARERRLAGELRAQLQLLESLPPSVPAEAIDQCLAEELGPLDQHGITLKPPAIAEASVAVVIPFEYGVRDSQRSRKEGVFKLLKPGIEQRMDEELRQMEEIGGHLDERCEELELPRLDYRDSFEQVRQKLQHEVHLDAEQIHLRNAALTYADDERVQIPEVLEFCTPRITAMERVTGGKITDHDRDSEKEKRGLAELVVESLIAQPIFSKAEQAVFHSDPHAGNLFLTDDDRLAILDWSLVGTLDKLQRIGITQIVLGALTLDVKRICLILEELSNRRPPDPQAMKNVVHDWLRRIRRGHFPGLKWLLGMLDDAVQSAGLRFPADMMLFRKSLYTLEGVVAELGPSRFNMDEVLVREFLCHFTVEWPKRWVSLPHSREFATRLSNWDLTQTMLKLPWTTGRFWLHECLDVVRTLPPNSPWKRDQRSAECNQ